ncbi:hypothetical protein C5S39_02000 [Candidatus Methanophagaceae archaeon]|jgi:uncharacterized protein with von Willebrand factor type A (vWA) domain|nr:hypothetical protein C5S39_02000 [Methanophagales archaeon]
MEEEEEKKVSGGFLGTVDDFYRESDQIFEEFDAILSKHSNGEDIMADLKGVRSKRPRIFGLIDSIYHKEAELEDKLVRGKVKQEQREKMLEFKARFSALDEDIDLLVIEEIGLLK